MSLRTRLLLTLGLTLMLLWGLAAAWLLSDLHHQVERTLDRRLAQSARMVAGLVSQLPAESWENVENRRLSIPPIEGLACQVHSPSGEIIARTHADMGDILQPREPGYSYRQAEGTQWRVFTYQRGDLTITTADRLDEREMLLRDVLMVAVVPFLVALLGSLVALWLGILRGLYPLSRLRDSLAMRHPDAIAPVATHDLPIELRPLIDTLNNLLIRIQQTVVREQRFTNDAAHELRTPLTAIKTHLQVARRVEGDAARRSLAQAEEGVARLARTLEQLLTLARIEGRSAFDDGGACHAEAIAERAMGDAQVEDKSRFALPAQWPEVELNMPCELAITALRNLIDNALHHGAVDKPVELMAEREGDALTFIVRDYGPGVDESILPQMTQRFWNGHNQQGSGLGLSIVAAIAERFEGKLCFTHPTGEGLEARLTLPIVTR